ncbi:hypothetical protein HNQ51_003780 [Inhella inkyongensis]|uniref:Lipoprotein n=1 Tax=Inhella inkyongensis TaxID=392593 RepID=A0A840SCE9_9BURK|nr:hypothetical protein [Inhella inkyongensis]MBB5206434.1 hypothetical protein [Inhella inkyongensis]
MRRKGALQAQGRGSSTPRWAPFALGLVLLLSACGSGVSVSQGNTPQQQRAMAMWQERCKKSGEFIHKTVEGVEGVYLVNVRTYKDNFNLGEQPADQFRLSDPYGNDLKDEGYLVSFVRNSYTNGRTDLVREGWPPHKGYRFIEAHDPKDGKLYRFTGRVEEPWQLDPTKHLKGYTRFVLDRTPLKQRTLRYGVQFEDISTREEREHWIAGSSLKVIDLETGEVLGERIGYMVDWAQGSRARARQPWTFAADNACPDFDRDFPGPIKGPANKSQSQRYQTLRFVEKVLKPIQ